MVPDGVKSSWGGWQFYTRYIHTYAGERWSRRQWRPGLLESCLGLLESPVVRVLSFFRLTQSLGPSQGRKTPVVDLPTYTKIPTTPYRIKARRTAVSISSAASKEKERQTNATIYLHRPAHSTNTLSSLTGCIAGCIAGCPGRTRLIIYYSRRPTPLQRKPSLLRSASEILPHQTIRPIEAMAVLVSPLS